MSSLMLIPACSNPKSDLLPGSGVNRDRPQRFICCLVCYQNQSLSIVAAHRNASARIGIKIPLFTVAKYLLDAVETESTSARTVA